VDFSCTCSTKRSVELKCGHFICIGCTANFMKEVETGKKELNEIKCSQCSAKFEIGNSILFLFII